MVNLVHQLRDTSLFQEVRQHAFEVLGVEEDAHLILIMSLISFGDVTLICYVKNLLLWYVVCFLLFGRLYFELFSILFTNYNLI